MYMRLWWKDARQFWPIWALLLLMAMATQLLLHIYADAPVRGTVPGVLAMVLPALYAFAVGAAAFAGERETGTLRLLDILPASRPVVWAGKVSFALATTLALAAILMALALLDSERIAPPWQMQGLDNLVRLGGLLLEGLAMGLFCSSILSSALVAAVAAIGLTGFSLYLMAGWLGGPVAMLAAELVMALAALVGSRVAFTWGHGGRLIRLGVELRSPLVVTAPAPARVVAPAVWPTDRPRPRSRLVELRALAWQTLREGRGTWFLLAAIGLVCPAILLADRNNTNFGPIEFSCCGIIALLAGVSVFGLENRRRTYRVLAHHGARPGLVWLTKVAAWCFGLALIWAPLVCVILLWLRTPSAFERWIMLGLNLPTAFALAVLCGMAIPRGITAGVVAMLLAMFIGLSGVGLLQAGLLPLWGFLALPLALLFVTWAWSGDWLLDRPAPGRWVRLGLILCGTLGAVFAGYAGWRAWSIPDVGPIAPPASWAAATDVLPPDRNAAELYRQAASWTDLPTVPSNRAVPVEKLPDLDRHPKVFDLIRRAAALPEYRPGQPARFTLGYRDPADPPMRGLAEAVAAHARGRLGRGDLAAAWDDIMILFRMARHTGRDALISDAMAGLAIEKQALDLAMDWANAPGQTPDRLRGAMVADLALPPMTPPAEVARAEGLVVERTIRLPVADLKELLSEFLRGWTTSPWGTLWLDAITTPWERARAVRLTRLATSEAVRLASIEYPMRPADLPYSMAARPFLGPANRSPLAELLTVNIGGYLNASERNEVARRGLLLVMAVRDWVLRHDGRFPERLDDLVPDELPSLPPDPYSGRPFAWDPKERIISGIWSEGRYPVAPREDRPQTPR